MELFAYKRERKTPEVAHGGVQAEQYSDCEEYRAAFARGSATIICMFALANRDSFIVRTTRSQKKSCLALALEVVDLHIVVVSLRIFAPPELVWARFLCSGRPCMQASTEICFLVHFDM